MGSHRAPPEKHEPKKALEVSGYSHPNSSDAPGSVYESFFEKAPDAMLILSAKEGDEREERILHANVAAASLFGLSRTALIGRDLAGFLEDDSGLFESAQQTGDRRFIRGDGRTRILEFSSARNFLPHRHLVVLRDVTERRVSEKIRHDAERELKSVLDNVDVIISRYDRGLRFIYTNLQMKRVTGIAPHSVIGKRLDELPFPPDDVVDWNENLRHVFETGNALLRETFTAANPPGFQYFESTLTPEFDANGDVVSVMTISRNISKRKEAEENRRKIDEELRRLSADLTDSRKELRHQTALFHLVVDQMAEGLVLCDPQGRLVYLNRAAKLIFPNVQFTDMERVEEMRRHFSVKGSQGGEDQLPLSRALRGESVDDVELFVRVPESGQTFWLQVSARPVVDDNGKLKCAVAVFRDFTSAREAENRLEQAAGDVRRKAEQLERSNADLEQFAYVASHDLKEPLRMVTSYVQLLERRYRENLDDDARQFIDFAVDGARRMYTLLDELLRYYRAGKHERSLVAVESSDLYHQVLHELEVHCEETGGEITHGLLPLVLGDPPQLRQLFYNLMENAIKFRSEKPPRIHVEAVRSEANPREWQFSIRDNGIGIVNGAPERVFGIFQRLHRRDNLTGTGIGLAICRRIVTRHGGRIWFESKPGEGTVFYFTLPAAEAAA